MHIQYVEVGNFRKLQAARIDFSEKTTVFVGANNSGKTSAMVALRRFLVDRANFSINDLTLTHWAKLDAAAVTWGMPADETEKEAFDWGAVLPHVDVWLNVPMNQLHYVQKILPTLDWDGSHIGVRLRYEPKDMEALKREYLAARAAAATVMNAAQPGGEAPAEEAVAATDTDAFVLWPRSMMDFLSRRLRSTFEVRAYLLDPAKLTDPKGGEAFPQTIPDGSDPIDGDPFKGLIRIDEISAQRGFGFAPTSARGDDDEDDSAVHGGKKLSSQLRSYYAQHLDPFDQPEPKDLDALQALHDAQTAFGKRLATSFSVALKELENIGYPGVTDPKLTITTNIKPVDGLNHGSAVQYEVPTHLAVGGYVHRLPEDSNGLGYQNLVSMVFALMSFRDKWMRVGKASRSTDTEQTLIPPLHLVLIEEPEAHLHAQVQQVFIAQAYQVLRKHDNLKESDELRTQLVVSTHSSHLAHEADFTSLRYFRRMPVKDVAGSVPISSVVNLSQVFGSEDQTERFVKRYLKVTHCDLFFADGAILVEGPAERIVVPHLVRKRDEYEYLRRCYITWLEIGGSHAHRLKSLLTHLGLNTLIITDIDAKDANNKAVPPLRGAGLRARNETLKTWIPKEESLDALLEKTPADLVSSDSSGYGVRVAYQQPIQATFKTEVPAEALANTFEDALVYENIELFRAMKGTGLVGRFRDALEKSADLQELADKVAHALGQGGKAEFAMDLLDSDEIDKLKVPSYIDGGLLWLAQQLQRKEDDIAGKITLMPVAEAANDSAAGEAAA
ncbi:AAA family ATPase [Variovorax sp. LjRoot175]|uniref:AAA family ATPase n=1 Tax=Variovorax sp. LjRoot175 TaxID=3342276 RepID=UPI003ECEF03C